MHLLLTDDWPKTRFTLQALLRWQSGLSALEEAANTAHLLTLAEGTFPNILPLGWALRRSPPDQLLRSLRSRR